MLGSNLPLRLAGGIPQVYARAYTLARPAAYVRVAAVSSNIAFASQRSYATPGRPKGAVGEPTKTVKRAVKRTAADKPTKAPKAPKAAAKSKPKSKPKTAAKKKPKVKRVPKVITEEDKIKAAAKLQRVSLRLQKAEIKELKVLALAAPKDVRAKGHVNAWSIFSGEKTKEALRGSPSLEDARTRLTSQMQANSAAYKDLSPAELEHYNHLANERNAQKKADFSAWLLTHTPDQIRVANIARRKLRSKLTAEKAKEWRDLDDDRLVKRAITPYAAFFRERILTGDFKNIGVKDAATLMSREWTALTDGEKQKYHDIHKSDIERYQQEYSEVYGHAQSPPADI